MENTVRRRNPYLVEEQGNIGRPSLRNTEEERRSREMDRRRRAMLRRKRIRRRRMAMAFCAFCMFALSATILFRLFSGWSAGWGKADEKATAVSNSLRMALRGQDRIQGLPADTYNTHPAWTEDFLTTNEYSRPGDPLTEVKSIFVHYTANRNTSAAQNRSYFEQLKDTHERSASAHFIIGYDGEIIECIPLDEIAYAVQTRNMDSISIECCYTSEDGSFTQETYDSLIGLLRWLTDVYELDTDDILRHYDCGGKKCPIYYTDHPDAWDKLKEDVADLS